MKSILLNMFLSCALPSLIYLFLPFQNHLYNGRPSDCFLRRFRCKNHESFFANVRALILRILCLKETSRKGSICKEKSGMAPMTLSPKSKNIHFKPIRNLSVQNLQLTIWSGDLYPFFKTGSPLTFQASSHPKFHWLVAEENTSDSTCFWLPRSCSSFHTKKLLSISHLLITIRTAQIICNGNF